MSNERKQSLRLGRIIPHTVGPRMRLNKMHEQNLSKWREGEDLNLILSDAMLRHEDGVRRNRSISPLAPRQGPPTPPSPPRLPPLKLSHALPAGAFSRWREHQNPADWRVEEAQRISDLSVEELLEEVRAARMAGSRRGGRRGNRRSSRRGNRRSSRRSSRK